MKTATDFHLEILVPATAQQVFDSICRVNEWWATDLTGETRGADSEFRVRFGETFVDFRITDFQPGRSVAWSVVDSYLPWLEDKTEWTGTTVRFELDDAENGTRIRFVHEGLQPEVECFEQCSQGWTHYFSQSLPQLIVEGNGLLNRAVCSRATHE